MTVSLAARAQVTLFGLSKQLLSQQQHYDWGLRALKTSLGIAGRELRDVSCDGCVRLVHLNLCPCLCGCLSLMHMLLCQSSV